MQQLTRIPLVVERFFTKYTPDPADPAKMIGVDYVTYGSVGEFKSRTTDRVSRLRAVIDDPEKENPGVLMAKLRWDAIEPSYEAWKAGRSAPVNGTPLAAWNLLQPEQADLFRMKGVLAIEDIAAMSGEQVRAMGFPNGHDIVRQASAFVQAADTTRGAAAFDEMKRENETLRAELDEIKAMLLKEAAADEQGDDEDAAAPRRRGRPSNAESAAREEAAA